MPLRPDCCSNASLLLWLLSCGLACGGQSSKPPANSTSSDGSATSGVVGSSSTGSDSIASFDGEASFGGSSSSDESSAGAAGVASNEPRETPTLCDGSEDVRVVFAGTLGYVTDPMTFVGAYGSGFFAIDGQCRFWQSKAADGKVYTGTLTPERAQAFARDLHFGEFSPWTRTLEESGFESCIDCGVRVLRTAEGTITCSRHCTDNPYSPAGRNQAFAAAFAASTGLFVVSEALTGPAQIALFDQAGLLPGAELYTDPTAVPWPLARAPSSAELLVPQQTGGYAQVDESSGASVDDPQELALLRGARDEFARTHADAWATRVSFSEPDARSPTQLYLLLRDEPPPRVHAALVGGL